MRIRRSHQAASLAALLATGALVAGCGGSDDNSTTATLSQSEFVAKATAICKPANQRIEVAAHKYLGTGGPPTPQAFEQFATAAVIPETQTVIDEFNALTPPADSAQAYDAMVAELQSVNDRLKANPQALSQQGDPFAKANQLARQTGLDVCAAD
ncbi:MAG: hypothetical protein WB462_14750 [Solirubrobacterales bacterium]